MIIRCYVECYVYNSVPPTGFLLRLSEGAMDKTNVEKKAFKAPTLVEYGTLSEITENHYKERPFPAESAELETRTQNTENTAIRWALWL